MLSMRWAVFKKKIAKRCAQVALHGGAPNKNIGDAFLLVWKFPKGCTEEDIAEAATSLPAKVILC